MRLSFLLVSVFLIGSMSSAGTAQGVKLLAEEAAAYDQFGEAVAANRNRVVVGASFADGADFNTGKVFVWRGSGNQLALEATLEPQLSYLNDYFGLSVAMHRDVIVVGSQSADGQPGLESRGTAHVFRRVDGAWLEEARLAPLGLAPYAHFADALAVEGRSLAIGAPGQFLQNGAVFLYQRSGGRWIQEDLLSADHPGEARFGNDLQLRGRTLAVSSVTDGEFAPGGGTVSIFDRQSDGQWAFRQKLSSPDIADYDSFGYSISLQGEWLAAGTPHDDNEGPSTGAVYMFREQGGQFAFVQKLIAPDAHKHGWFGRAVGVHGDRLVVGALNAEADPAYAGSAYQFRWDGSAWQNVELTLPSTLLPLGEFGADIAFTGARFVAGVPYDTEAAENAGAAFVVELQDTVLAR